MSDLKICTKCKVAKPKTDFYTGGKCKPCKYQLNREWQKANPQQVRKMNKDWQSANRVKVRSANKRWAKKHPEVFRGYSKTWRKKNPEAVNIMKRRVYVRLYKAEGSHTATEIKNLYLSQGGVCANGYCKASFGKYEVDHIVPLSLGGSDYIKNIQLLCPPCNRRKNNYLPEKWQQREKLRFEELAYESPARRTPRLT